MMYNTAVELCPSDRKVSAKVATASKGLKKIYDAVVKAQKNGDILTLILTMPDDRSLLVGTGGSWACFFDIRHLTGEQQSR